MFAKLRRRRLAATIPTRPQAPAVPQRPEPSVADSETLARADRLRAALHEVGLDLERLGPEPLWLADVRAGQPVPLGPDERTELVAYAGIVSTASLASDDACAVVLRQIEAIPVLREMREEGMTIHSCGEQMSASSLRAVQEAVRKAAREREEKHPAAAATE
ncbi:hypothetical protein ACIP6P_26395 [Streptomyces sp. NPDC088729]|uniref:hypothetical protein n=1 Tax=Streptomyces sp. NPDC088729 TaxID=3365876 RepID=UPI003810B3B0